jgi:hypothetical protein
MGEVLLLLSSMLIIIQRYQSFRKLIRMLLMTTVSHYKSKLKSRKRSLFSNFLSNQIQLVMFLKNNAKRPLIHAATFIPSKVQELCNTFVFFNNIYPSYTENMFSLTISFCEKLFFLQI